MGKRKSQSKTADNKRFKVNTFIDPGTSGIYATCNRGREQQCRKELLNLFSEKLEQYYNLSEFNDASDNEEKETLSIEDQIKKELSEMKENKNSKKEFMKPIELGCECLIFVKTRSPIDPETFVERICSESLESKSKTTRFTQKLTPITYSATPTIDEIKKLAKKVLKPHFHSEVGQKPYKFAIQISRRNFNAISKDEMIKSIAECVGRDFGHSVDLKNYDKLILVECFKSNVGISVVNDYERLERFNLQQIFEKNSTDDNFLSRVKNNGAESKPEVVTVSSEVTST